MFCVEFELDSNFGLVVPESVSSTNLALMMSTFCVKFELDTLYQISRVPSILCQLEAWHMSSSNLTRTPLTLWLFGSENHLETQVEIDMIESTSFRRF